MRSVLRGSRKRILIQALLGNDYKTDSAIGMCLTVRSRNTQTVGAGSVRRSIGATARGSQVRWVIAISLVLFLALTLEVVFIYSFEKKHNAEIIDAILAENFDRADQLIASDELTTRRIADLYFFNDSERQAFFKSTGDPDQNLCRLYHRYFENRRFAFQPAWRRYIFHLSIGACLRVLDDPKNALAEYQTALKLSRWLGTKQQRLTSRRVAALYLRDRKGYSDIPDRTESFISARRPVARRDGAIRLTRVAPGRRAGWALSSCSCR